MRRWIRLGDGRGAPTLLVTLPLAEWWPPSPSQRTSWRASPGCRLDPASGELLFEAGSRLGEQDAVLGALGTGYGGFYGGEVEVKGRGVLGFGCVGGVEEALLAEVGFDESDVLLGAAGKAQILQGFGVDREDAAGGSVLGGHVGDGGAIGEGQLGDAGAEELDELADDAVLAQSFGDGEDEVGGGGAFAQLAGEAEADDLRNEHGDGLAEHGGFGLDAADAPTEDAEAVDHGGVGVGADQGVGIGGDFAVGVGAVVKTTRARYSRLTWWQMPMPGGRRRSC